MSMLSSQRELHRSSVIIGTIHAAALAMRGAMLVGDVDQFASAAAQLRAAEDELMAMSPGVSELRRQRLGLWPEND